MRTAILTSSGIFERLDFAAAFFVEVLRVGIVSGYLTTRPGSDRIVGYWIGLDEVQMPTGAPDPARELFDRLVAVGEPEILRVLRRFDAEKDYIDFKIIGGEHGDRATLTDHDRKNLAKAMSGFWNTAGGVIVWGIECSGNGAPADRACLPGLLHADQLHGELLRERSRVVRPPMPDVDIVPVKLLSGRAVLIMYVPWRGDRLPAEAHVSGSRGYYFRIGESFEPLAPDILAGMMGAKPASRVVPIIEPTNDTARLALNIYIENRGRGMAFHVYLLMDWGGESPKGNPTYASGNNEMGKYDMGERGRYVLGGPGMRLPPGARVVVGNLAIPLDPRPIRLRFQAGAEHDLSTIEEHEFSEDAVRAAYEAARGGATSSQLWQALLDADAAGNGSTS